MTEGGRLAWALAQESCASPRFHFFRILEPYRIEPKSFKHTSTAVTVLDKKLANTLHRRGCESISHGCDA